jgi:hypothetical protein
MTLCYIEPIQTIEDLSTSLICNILLNINDNNTFKNARLTNKIFYRILKNYKVFSKKNKLTKIIYFKNNNPIKIDTFLYLQNYSFNNRITDYYNYKKNGPCVEYNVFNQIVSKSYYKDNLLDGISKQYYNNTLIESTTFKNGDKHGWTHQWFDTIHYDKKYVLGILCNIVKYNCNMMIYQVQLKNSMFHGQTIVYDRHNKYNNIKNSLNFKYNNLDGTCSVTEFDRILKMQYKFGYLNGTQMVFSKDNELQFVGKYIGGVLCGNYIVFRNSVKKEEGTLDIFGNYNKYTVYNGSDYSKIEYPLVSSKLNGIYKELIGSYTVTLSFKDNAFNGYYLLNDSNAMEQIEIKIYNRNNFVYKKIEKHICTVIIKKTMGTYSLILYNHTNKEYNLFYLNCFMDNETLYI